MTGELKEAKEKKRVKPENEEKPATYKQKSYIRSLINQGKIPRFDRDTWNNLTIKQAADVLSAYLDREKKD